MPTPDSSLQQRRNSAPGTHWRIDHEAVSHNHAVDQRQGKDQADRARRRGHRRSLSGVGGHDAAHAQDPPCIVNGRTTRVLGHHDIWVDARSQSTQVAVIQPGRAINVTYLSGTVWSGTWFTAPNGPQGWLNWPAPISPISNTAGGPESPWAAPGVNLYSMVGQVSPVDRRGFQWNQPFFHATAGSDRCVQSRLAVTYSVTMNDQRFDDNTGGFWVRVEDLG